MCGRICSTSQGNEINDSTRRAMKPLPVRVRVYLIVVVATATVLLGKFAALPRADELYLFLAFAAATIATSVFKLRLPSMKNGATLSIAFIIDFAALLLFG